jgi:RNA polymerase sigma factor (sigma-70 family)
MSSFNPSFWEVVVDQADLESFTNEDALWYECERASCDEPARARRTREVFARINELIRTELTARQRQVVRLYFLAELTEQEVACRLDIPQQVVSQHLFGIIRNGKRIGGAIPQLRKLCEKRGIAW